MYHGNGTISLGFEMTGAESVVFYAYSYQMNKGGYSQKVYGINSGDGVVLSSGTDYVVSHFNDPAYTIYGSYIGFAFQDNNQNQIENYVAGIRIYSWLPFKYVTDNKAPIFSSSNTASVTSKTDVATVVLDVNATNGDGGTDESDITYSLSGTDANDFVIDSDDGELRFVATPDHGAPTDANSDNVYDIIVTANDGGNGNNITDQAITITVEAGGVSAVDIVVSSSIAKTLTEQELTTAGITQTGLTTDQLAIISNYVASANPVPNTKGDLQTIVDAALAEELAVNVVVSSSVAKTLTEQELTTAGITQTGLTTDQLAIISNYVAVANPAPNTKAELQTIVDTALAQELAVNVVVSSSKLQKR